MRAAFAAGGPLRLPARSLPGTPGGSRLWSRRTLPGGVRRIQIKYSNVMSPEAPPRSGDQAPGRIETLQVRGRQAGWQRAAFERRPMNALASLLF